MPSVRFTSVFPMGFGTSCIGLFSRCPLSILDESPSDGSRAAPHRDDESPKRRPRIARWGACAPRRADAPPRRKRSHATTTMTDEPETTVEDALVEHLSDLLGEHNVARQHRFDDDRVADVIASDPSPPMPLTYAIEVENDGQSVLNGGGQAAYYAAKAREEFLNVIPVLAVPADHISAGERHTIEKTGVVVMEVSA